MFHRLVASRPRPARRALTGGGVAALLSHGVLLAGVAWATLRPDAPARAAGPTLVIPWPERSDRRVARGPRVPTLGPDDPGPVVIEVPPGLPPSDPRVRLDALPWRVGASDGVGLPPSSDAGVPWNPTMVEEPPALLAGHPPIYPELLRSAGIGGRVIVQAVVDTFGRAEPGTAAVIASPNPGFDGPARAYVLGALFRPARVHGRAVRVLVSVPIDFALTPSR